MDIDWNQIPKSCNYVATDASGNVYAYRDKPVVHENGAWIVDNGNIHTVLLEVLEYPGWRDSLQERPKETGLDLSKPIRFKDYHSNKVYLVTRLGGRTNKCLVVYHKQSDEPNDRKYYVEEWEYALENYDGND